MHPYRTHTCNELRASDAGKTVRLSGWMFRVNGEFPCVGCSDVKVRNGDRIEFVYSCDTGGDVGKDSELTS